MTKPERAQDGAERRDGLDRLHEQGKRRAERLPHFDAEETLRNVLDQAVPPSPPTAAEGHSATVALPIGRRVFRLSFDLYPREPHRGGRSRSLSRAGDSGLPGLGRGRRMARLAPRPGSGRIVSLTEEADAAAASGSANFWEGLGSAEQAAFLARAEERVYAHGARLMREGERADFVVVLIRGAVRISIGSGDTEQVIAVRGPGQLVGERAALQVSVRSATVTAVDIVHALTMTTADFAAFIGEHPGVLDLVEAQVYDRLTEGPELRELPGSSWADTAQVLPGPSRSRDIEPLRRPFRGENCTVVFSDVIDFGAGAPDGDRSIVRATLRQTMADAFGNIWNAAHSIDRGDGLLVVVPPEIPTSDVLDCMRTALPPTVRRHNTGHPSSARMQLRVALDVGPVVSDGTEPSGDVIRRAARLALAPALKRAMSKNRATVGVIVSDFIYETAIREADDPIDTDYEEIHVEVKQAALPTRIQLIA